MCHLQSSHAISIPKKHLWAVNTSLILGGSQWFFAMHRCILFILSAFMAMTSHADGFLLTPKFRYFLNQMRDTQPHNEFITRWDFGNRYDTNRISYTYMKGKSPSTKVLIWSFARDFRDEISLWRIRTRRFVNWSPFTPGRWNGRIRIFIIVFFVKLMLISDNLCDLTISQEENYP